MLESTKTRLLCNLVFRDGCFSLLGSGPVGDDDLWYHHIPGTLRFLFFPPSPGASHLSLRPSQLALGPSQLALRPSPLALRPSQKIKISLWWYHRSSTPMGPLPPITKLTE